MNFYKPNPRRHINLSEKTVYRYYLPIKKEMATLERIKNGIK